MLLRHPLPQLLPLCPRRRRRRRSPTSTMGGTSSLFPLVEPPRSIAVAAPDAVPSAAAAAEEEHDDPMEIDEVKVEEEPVKVIDQVNLEVNRKVSAVLKNEADEGNEAEVWIVRYT